jgi:uncharacterized protein (TIGR00290 family)
VKILLSWSSGKDSAWALHVLNTTLPGAVGGLLTTVNSDAARVAMHGVRRELLHAQARAAGLPLLEVDIPQPCPNETYEERMRDACARAVAAGFTHVAFGDLFLEDVRRYREERLAGTGLAPLFPLWGLPTRELADEMIDAGLQARLSVIDSRILDRSFAGRGFDRSLLRDLPAAVDPCGEHGEFHTFACAGPMFGAPIDVETGEVVVRDPFVFIDLKKGSGTISGGNGA